MSVSQKICFIVDVRPYQKSRFTGISRFQQGLLAGLIGTAAKDSRIRVHCAGVTPADNWLSEMLNLPKNPSSYHHIEESLIPSKPRFLWSTFAYKKIRKELEQSDDTAHLVWISSDNIDRPLQLGFSFNNANHQNVVQFLHDVTPLEGRPTPLAFQIRHLTSGYLKKGLMLFTVSEHSKKGINKHFKADPSQVEVVSNMLDERFLKELARQGMGVNQRDVETYPELCVHTKTEEEGLRSSFLLCVGRDESYKRWDAAFDSVFALNNKLSEDEVPFSMVFVGQFQGSCPSFLQGAEVVFSSTKFTLHIKDNVRVFVIKDASDSLLVSLYLDCFALLHPSEFEGYGFPIVEAYMSGTPVFCRPDMGVSSTMSVLSDQAHFHMVPESDGNGWSKTVANLLMDIKNRKPSENPLVSNTRLANKQCQSLLCNWQSAVAPLVGVFLKKEQKSC